MKFEEWFKVEYPNQHVFKESTPTCKSFYDGASVAWDYKQTEIDALQKRIAIYEKHVSAIKNIHKNQFNDKSDAAWVLGSLDGFFKCLENELKGDKND